jgi:hypothetical protein
MQSVLAAAFRVAPQISLAAASSRRRPHHTDRIEAAKTAQKKRKEKQERNNGRRKETPSSLSPSTPQAALAASIHKLRRRPIVPKPDRAQLGNS